MRKPGALHAWDGFHLGVSILEKLEHAFFLLGLEKRVYLFAAEVFDQLSLTLSLSKRPSNQTGVQLTRGFKLLSLGLELVNVPVHLSELALQ